MNLAPPTVFHEQDMIVLGPDCGLVKSHISIALREMKSLLKFVFIKKEGEKIGDFQSVPFSTCEKVHLRWLSPVSLSQEVQSQALETRKPPSLATQNKKGGVTQSGPGDYPYWRGDHL
ncbi:hypothetical protein E2C01_053282 [Portunus trituberculatus]|uniref:Uncharacterized protein n=1 Tax=Portunus trituberculatus TaxID=210409 RepID=A0A5B7GRL5_PORTR|nr:hypothetical protein [Portunus trituberculatus]